MKNRKIDTEKNEPKPPVSIAMAVNALIMLLYLVSIPPNDTGTKAWWIFVHFVAALVVSVILIGIKKTQHIGKAVGLATLTIPLIGLGLCFVTTDIKSLAK